MKKKETTTLIDADKSHFPRFSVAFLTQYTDHLGNSLVELTIFVFSRFNLCFGFLFSCAINLRTTCKNNFTFTGNKVVQAL